MLTPALLGRTAQMNRVAVFAGLLFWSWMWGIWGTLLAVPMMMVVKVVCDHVEDFSRSLISCQSNPHSAVQKSTAAAPDERLLCVVAMSN